MICVLFLYIIICILSPPIGLGIAAVAVAGLFTLLLLMVLGLIIEACSGR